jgi:hypothetical protein
MKIFRCQHATRRFPEGDISSNCWDAMHRVPTVVSGIISPNTKYFSDCQNAMRRVPVIIFTFSSSTQSYRLL